MEEYLIRRGNARDAPALAEFGARSFEEAFGADNRPEDIASYLAQTYGAPQQQRELDDPNIVTLIVEEGGRMIGFAQMRRGPDADAIEIARFYVDRAWHGRGIAQTLMDAVDEAAASLDLARIWLGVWERNPRAISFYAKCGFEDIGSHPFLVGSDLQTDRVMSRPVRKQPLAKS